MATQRSAVDLMSLLQLSSSQLALLDRPQALLDDPEPHTKLGLQIRQLEQHGLDKAATAVKICGRLGEKWTYECGRSFLRKIIRSHRRFCCSWCDRHVAERLFEEHRAYRERLHPSGTLHRVTVRSSDYPISSDGVRDFEEALVEAVRRSFKGCQGWGLKSWTDYEDGCLVAKGIVYLPPGASLPPGGMQIPSATCTVGRATSVTDFEAMLADILRPSLTEDHGVLRADLMAAFHGGNHLRSLGVFYGLITKKREEKHLVQSQEKLHLSSAPQSGATFVEPFDPTTTDVPGATILQGQNVSAPSVSGTPLVDHLDLTSPYLAGASLVKSQGPSAPCVSKAALVQQRDLSDLYVPPCPHCGPGCERVSVSREPMTELQDIPRFEGYTSTEKMLLLLRRRYEFWEPTDLPAQEEHIIEN